jgi:adenylate cyclase
MNPNQEADQAQGFVFADIAGFTSLTEAHGDERAADVVEHFCAHAAELLERFEGEQVKTIGDAVMIRTGSAPDAVRFGIELAHHQMAQPEHPRVSVGIAWGAASERGGDWIGTTVNVAARLAELAASGEVLINAAGRTAAGEVSGVSFAARGMVALRGLRREVEIFEARCEDAAAALLIDPVCRMAVDPSRGAGRRSHGGVEYHFCSRACLRAFEAEPSAFVARS